MRTALAALQEVRDRISYFCARTDGKYEPAWAKEIVGIIDDVKTSRLRTTEKSSEVCDAAKIRKELMFVKQYFDKIDPFNIDTYTFAQIEVEYIKAAISAALAAPRRNCEVGTADEQYERWRVFCGRYAPVCAGCPCESDRSLAYCFARWAQMPYEKGGKK